MKLAFHIIELYNSEIRFLRDQLVSEVGIESFPWAIWEFGSIKF